MMYPRNKEKRFVLALFFSFIDLLRAIIILSIVILLLALIF